MCIGTMLERESISRSLRSMDFYWKVQCATLKFNIFSAQFSDRCPIQFPFYPQNHQPLFIIIVFSDSLSFFLNSSVQLRSAKKQQREEEIRNAEIVRSSEKPDTLSHMSTLSPCRQVHFRLVLLSSWWKWQFSRPQSFPFHFTLVISLLCPLRHMRHSFFHTNDKICLLPHIIFTNGHLFRHEKSLLIVCVLMKWHEISSTHSSHSAFHEKKLWFFYAC